MTPRQRKMLIKYDREAARGNKPAAVIALALRIKICRACSTCRGIGSIGGDKYPTACPTCLLDGVIDTEGVCIGRTTGKKGAAHDAGVKGGGV